MIAVREQPFLPIDVAVDRYDLAETIRTAFAALLGEAEVVDVHVSQFPHEYGAIVLLKHQPSAEVEAQAVALEEQLRAASIRVGILVRKARNETHSGLHS